jgi:hypothetical protein
MDEVAARASLVPASEVSDGVTTSIPRSEIEEVLDANEMPIELVLDVSRLSDGESTDAGSVAVSWERSELERLLREAQGDEVVLTFDRETLRSALEDDVEAHGLREIALALVIGGTAAAGVAATAAAEPGPMLGTAPPVTQPAGPDDRALPRTSPPTLSPDDRAVARVSPTEAPTAGITPDDRALPRTPPPALSPDDRAAPRGTPVETPTPGVLPDDRAVPRGTPVAEPSPAPDDRAVPRGVEGPTPGVSPVDRAVPRGVEGPTRGAPVDVPATGTVSDPGISWAPSPSETAIAAGLIALAITGAYFIVGGRRRPRIRPT